jgi:hypothetical protein
MYAATATIHVAIDKLDRFPGNMDSTLLIEARSELEIARNLLESRWQIWNSIYWRRANTATKHSVKAKLEGLAFDALAGVTNAGRLLNRYVDTVGVLDEKISLWSEIIHCLDNAYRWISESYYYDCLCKQLKLSIALESN